MSFIYTIFIALANNIDNISVRIAYSIRGVKISVLKNLWISIITFFISSFAAFLGVYCIIEMDRVANKIPHFCKQEFPRIAKSHCRHHTINLSL